MPAADLKSDIKANVAELENLKGADGEPLALTATEQLLVSHLKNTLWPFVDALVDQISEHEAALEESDDLIEELGEAIDDLTENRGSVLMPAEAGVFAVVVQLSRDLIGELKRGARPSEDKIHALGIACDAAEKTIQQITINVDLDDAEDDGEDDDTDDDD